MHLLFVDESGTPPRPGIQSRYFVVAGVIVPEAIWHRLRDAILGLKLRYKIRGEIKWRYFAPGNDDLGNPMKGLDQVARNQIRTDMIKIITSESSIKTLGCICSAAAAYEIPSNRTPADLYHATYNPHRTFSVLSPGCIPLTRCEAIWNHCCRSSRETGGHSPSQPSPETALRKGRVHFQIRQLD